MTKVFTFIIAAFAFASPGLSFAHGGGPHVMGTVKTVGESSLTVDTKDKGAVTIRTDAKTKFEKSGSSATAKDLAVGDRIVVHTSKPEKTGELVAVIVKFGAAEQPEKHDHAGKSGHAHDSEVSRGKK